VPGWSCTLVSDIGAASLYTFNRSAPLARPTPIPSINYAGTGVSRRYRSRNLALGLASPVSSGNSIDNDATGQHSGF
jgi:hypothetical protein